MAGITTRCFHRAWFVRAGTWRARRFSTDTSNDAFGYPGRIFLCKRVTSPCRGVGTAPRIRPNDSGMAEQGCACSTLQSHRTLHDAGGSGSKRVGGRAGFRDRCASNLHRRSGPFYPDQTECVIRFALSPKMGHRSQLHLLSFNPCRPILFQKEGLKCAPAGEWSIREKNAPSSGQLVVDESIHARYETINTVPFA